MASSQRGVLSFGAFYGLERLATTHAGLEDALRERIEACDTFGFQFRLDDERATTMDYSVARIADSFFSDSFPPELLKDLFRAITKRGSAFKVSFTLLHPFSDLARVRADALESKALKNVLWRLNRGLYRIVAALAETQTGQDRASFSLDKEALENEPASFRNLENILEQVVKGKSRVDVRFTNEYTDLPCYIIGPYAFKGTMFLGTSARDNPWSIYVDDPTTSMDAYSRHKATLEKLHERAVPAEEVLGQVREHRQSKRTIFVSWGGGSQGVMRWISDEIKKKRYDGEETFRARDFDQVRDKEQGTHIQDILQSTIDRASGAIVLMLGADRVVDANGKESKRARQNVVHELGLVQQKFPPNRVLIVVEEGVELPSNLDGRMVFRDSRQSLEDTNYKLLARINELLDKVRVSA